MLLPSTSFSMVALCTPFLRRTCSTRLQWCRRRACGYAQCIWHANRVRSSEPLKPWVCANRRESDEQDSGDDSWTKTRRDGALRQSTLLVTRQGPLISGCFGSTKGSLRGDGCQDLRGGTFAGVCGPPG